MKAYWDSSALIKALADSALRSRLANEGGFTRSHSLCEVFSSLTSGRLLIRVDAAEAARAVRSLAADLNFSDLSHLEILDALDECRQKGVRGGRIYDYIHALAAEKSGAAELLTADIYDFDSLSETLQIVRI